MRWTAYMAVSPYWLAFRGRVLATINISPENNAVANLPDASKEQYQHAGNWELVISETVAFSKGSCRIKKSASSNTE
jgi:hypothetical protein